MYTGVQTIQNTVNRDTITSATAAHSMHRYCIRHEEVELSRTHFYDYISPSQGLGSHCFNDTTYYRNEQHHVSSYLLE